MASLEEALTLLKSGRLREGMEILENLVGNDPENVNVLYNLGMCYSQLGNIDKSIETLEKCVEIAPRHANALTALAYSYSRKGEYEKALGKLKIALEIDPDNFFALRNCGAVLGKLGRHEIVKRVNAVSGKQISFRPALDQLVPATSKIARARMPHHVIKYQPQMAHRINHLTAHECGHILRTMEADPSIRVVPVSNAETRATAVRELGKELSHLPEAMRSQMLDVWLGGLITQVTSLPVCVRIERWIHREYPSLRDEQRLYLDDDLQRTLQGLSKKVERMTPKTIFRISNSITYAYLRGLEPVTGKDLKKHFSGRLAIISTGIHLYEALGEEEVGYADDIRVINEWARLLKIDRWFAWIAFEDMPESYFKDV